MRLEARPPTASPGPPRAPAGLPLRVLHLITTLEAGGTETLLLTLARAQAALGLSIEVAVLRDPAPLEPAFRAAGFVVHRLGLRRALAPGAFFRLTRLLRRGRFDVLHTHLDLADLYGPFAARRAGVPIVVSSRHNTDEWRTRPSWKRRPFLLWERAAHRRVDAALAVSAAVRDFLVREEGLAAERFRVVHNGIDLEAWRAPATRLEARARLALFVGVPAAELQSRALIGFVGRLAPQKGADLLLEAAALLPREAWVVIVGDGPEGEALRQRAAQPDLAGRVLFAGRREAVPQWLPGFDLLAVPSRWEGFGLAAVEGLAAGVPVVAADVDGLREVIGDNEGGVLVSPGDAGALARALAVLLGNAEHRQALGRVGRERAFRRFGAARMAAEVVEIYQQAGRPHRTVADGAPPGDDIEKLVAVQVQSMWRGVLPPRLLAVSPAAFLRQQEEEYGAVADDVEGWRPLNGARLLDLGCGLGSMLVIGRARGASVFGIEPDGASLALCARRLAPLRTGGPPLMAGVGEALPLRDRSLDLVTCCSVLEHVRNPGAVLAEVCRVLRPGGWLYLGVPNALLFQERHYKIVLPPGLPRALRRAWVRLHGRDPAFLDTLHELTPGRALALVRGAGLEVVSSPVQRRLARLEEILAGRARASSPPRRAVLGLMRALGVGGLLRALVRRGFFVDGAIVARRPTESAA